jgi:FkbM family methyltransferase
MSDESFGRHVSKRSMMTIVCSIIGVSMLMIVWNSHSLLTFSGSQADLDHTDQFRQATLNLQRVVAELGVSARSSVIMQHDKQHFDDLTKITLNLERVAAKLSDTLLANQFVLNHGGSTDSKSASESPKSASESPKSASELPKSASELPKSASELPKSAFPETAVINFPFGITANRYRPSISESFWGKIGEWEKSTFATFHQYIHADTTVIDFGAWIGPTVLFAANLARRVIALECDPYAMAELSQSVMSNPRLSHKISLSRLCISDKRERLQMSGHGGSGSTLNSVSASHFQNYKAYAVSQGVIEKYEWEVDCVPLTDIIEENQITGDIFVKIDTEGAESFIVPSLKKWLESRRDRYNRLPTIFVSMHTGYSHLDKKPELLNGFLEVFKMYEKVILVPLVNSSSHYIVDFLIF